mmetsp:Transcript_27126/g.88663  ORF Transcript_27126/g.88663 Transcript_27126/m.88663 type:complete len:264 (-) Transcript_27126:1363-2154(-)
MTACYDVEQVTAEVRRGRGQVLEIGYGLGGCSLLSGLAGHRILAVKPDVQEYHLMKKSVALNNITSLVHVVHAEMAVFGDAGGGREETGNMDVASLFEEHSDEHRHSQEQAKLVGMRPLLSWFHEHGGLQLLQLSYRGLEVGLLRSAALQIQPHRIPYILFEFDPTKLLQRQHDPEELLEFLHAKGYRLLSLAEDTDVEPEDFNQFSREVGNSSTFLLAHKSEIKRPRQRTDLEAYSHLMYILSCTVAIVFGLMGFVLSMLHI